MELKRCLHCGNEELTVNIGETPKANGPPRYDFTFVPRANVICQACGTSTTIFEGKNAVAEAIAAWNRRYVCPDKHGKAVFEGNKVKYEIAYKEFLVCRVVEQKQPYHGYGLVGAGEDDYWTDTFMSRQIELIEGEDNG
jgi:hypothetical protein